MAANLWSERSGERSISARQKLFALYHPFAQRLARQHFRRSGRPDVELADFCQLAFTGLLEAIDHYDPANGAPFTAYARRRIAGAILDGVSKMTEVRGQLSSRHRARRDRARSLTADDPGSLSIEDAFKALADLAVGLALGFMLEGTTLLVHPDAPSPHPDAYESLAWKDTIRCLLNELAGLPEREQVVIRFHYLDGLAFDQIGRLLELSKGRISQLHKAGLERLRRRISRNREFSVS